MAYTNVNLGDESIVLKTTSSSGNKREDYYIFRYLLDS